MRTVIVAISAVAIMTAPAFSQGRGKGGGGKSPIADQQSEEKKQKEAAAEKAYKAVVDKMPDKKYDPWGTMRK